jgi:hypothetical protein
LAKYKNTRGKAKSSNNRKKQTLHSPSSLLPFGLLDRSKRGELAWVGEIFTQKEKHKHQKNTNRKYHTNRKGEGGKRKERNNK